MKTPIWEVSPGALLSLLNAGEFVQCDLHTFTLVGGSTVIRIAAADLNVTYPGGPLWSSTGARIDPKGSTQRAHWKRGLDVDQWQTIVLPRVIDPLTGDLFPDKIAGVPWIQAARQGALDGADYQVDRAYFAAWPQPYVATFTPVGILTIFAGLAVEVDGGDSQISLMFDDYRTLLSTSMPRNIYQGGCRNTLFDEGCKLDPAPFKVSNALLGSSTRSVLRAGAIVPGGSGTFALGRVVMTSGNNSGFSRTVSAYDASGVFTLLNPLPYDVDVGDTFDAYPGCDKTQATCVLFGNKPNFGGQPYIPSPETAI